MRWMEAPNCSIMHSRPPSSSTSYYSNNVSSGNNWAPSTRGLHKASFLARTARKKNGDPRSSSRQLKIGRKKASFFVVFVLWNKKGTATRKGIKITLNLRLLLCLFLFSYPTEYESCAVFVQVLSKENMLQYWKILLTWCWSVHLRDRDCCRVAMQSLSSLNAFKLLFHFTFVVGGNRRGTDEMVVVVKSAAMGPK